MHSSLARTIVEKLEGAPELRGIIDDRSVLATHRELIDLMMTAMVPAGRRDDYHAMAVEPFTMLPFYETPAWRSLGLIAFDRRANVEAIEGARAVGKSLLLCDECAPT